MSNKHALGKRQRETERARKKNEKAEERAARRRQGPADIEIVTAEELHGNMPSIEDAMRAIEEQGRVPRSSAAIPVRLFVGGLSDEVTDQDLRETFGAFGKVLDVVIMTDRVTRTSRGFGFVTMEDRRDGPRAIDGLVGTELKGRSLVVNVATERGR